MTRSCEVTVTPPDPYNQWAQPRNGDKKGSSVFLFCSCTFGRMKVFKRPNWTPGLTFTGATRAPAIDGQRKQVRKETARCSSAVPGSQSWFDGAVQAARAEAGQRPGPVGLTEARSMEKRDGRPWFCPLNSSKRREPGLTRPSGRVTACSEGPERFPPRGGMWKSAASRVTGCSGGLRQAGSARADRLPLAGCSQRERAVCRFPLLRL
ncbi:PREDICTED: uncharacterized protein LOC104835459 [Haliaeetus leucocephalus]|uniref:uncharacterized protein LOC104835459 n=1 Tax=Haliaeetus leucocephalus TaxID=52644 RepID=UPI00053CC91B|nr:PREDICTED: uncharacterized protein LOC104835459 [Haliaeetus leucocephalus]